jgi:hypothetical protein
MSGTFDPYHRWLGIPPHEQPPDHYRLLGIQRFEQDPDVIQSAADQRIAHLREFRSGPHRSVAHKLAKEVSSARLCLLKLETKAAYDEQLRRQGPSPRNGHKPPVRTAVGAHGSNVVPRKSEPGLVGPEEPGRHAPARNGERDAAFLRGNEPTAPLIAVHPTTPARTPRGSRMMPGVFVGLAGLVVVLGLLLWLSSRQAGEPVQQAAANGHSHPGSDRQDAPAPRPAQPVQPGPAKCKGVIATSGSMQETPVAGKAEEIAGTSQGPGPEDASPQPDVAPPVFQASDAKPLAGAKPADEESPAKKPEAEKPSGTPTTAPRQPVPPEDVRQQVAGQLNDVFKLKAARTAEDLLKVAKQLLDAAVSPKVSAAEQYVELQTAMALAAQGGDAALMLAAADQLGQRFETDAARLRETALIEFAAAAVDHPRIAALCTSSAAAIELAVREGRTDAALELATAVARACQRPDGREFRKEAAQRLAWTKTLGERHQQVQQAQAALKANPDDARANRLLAFWYCLEQKDWPRGLAHLAKAGDASLKALADRESTSPPTAQPDQIKLADAWYDLAQSKKGDEQDLCLLAAAQWYKQAGSSVAGLLKLKIEKRLEEVVEVEKRRLAERQRPPTARDPRGKLWRDVL